MKAPLKVTDADVERSYDLLALLAVCAFAADRLEDAGDDQASISGSIGRSLQLAGKLAGETHDLIELAKQDERS